MSKFLYTLGVITFLMTGCGKDSSVTSSLNPAIKTDKPKLKVPNLGRAENFAILAYASISSNAKSSIDGKVGIFPGTRDQIELDPSEVVGGESDIMGSDDETIPIDLLSSAKVDMVTAYKEAVSLSPDDDKIGLDIEKFKGKKLAPGCYKWNGDLTITNDLSLEGNETDIWIFKIPANFRISSGVQLTLQGEAQAKNIFWQVAGSAVLESNSVISGTIIAQQFVEMRKDSKLTGKAFAKNGYINLDRAKIIKDKERRRPSLKF